MSRLLLMDKSAYARGAAESYVDDELCLCAVSRMELLFSARNATEYAALETDLTEFRVLRMDVETFAIATGAQRELAAGGRHRVPIPDLLIAACAQQHGADVLHIDRQFDTLAEVLDFQSIRL